MKLSISNEPGTYVVSNLCKSLSKYLLTLDGVHRSSDGWVVKAPYIPELFRRAKVTGFYSSYDFDCADAELKVKIAKALGLKIKKTLLADSPSNSPFTTLYLTPDAPTFVVKAAWKALASELHPDRGGDPESFIKAQAAYNSIIAKKGG